MLKLVVLVIVGVLGWFAFRKIQGKFGGSDKPKTTDETKSDSIRNAPDAAPQPSRDAEAAADETEPCRVCGTYVSLKSPSSCGRSECPYRQKD